MEVKQVRRAENANADAVALISIGLEESLLKMVSIEMLERPSINELEQVGSIIAQPCWMDPIISTLHDGLLPEHKFEARRLRY